jgi:hypothetical protein
MKIRDLVQQKIRKFILIGLGGGLCLLASTAIQSSAIKQVVKSVGILGFIVAGVSSNFLLKCPCCDGNLTRTTMIGQSKANFCPRCGVGLDEEI